MAHVITQPCCNDASCVPVCPVNCIHPTPDEPDYGRAEMLYIDPDTCIDCGACLDVCPVEAIVPDDELDDGNRRYLDINALYYAQGGPPKRALPPPLQVTVVGKGERPVLRVAVIGSGPAATYAAEELLSRREVDARVTMFERLPTPWGLVRSGVAPDHPGTKAVTEQFERTAKRKHLELFLNVEVGTHVTHEELLRHHDALLYAFGASEDRTLGIPGEGLPGSLSGTAFVGWYNGHPDFAHLTPPLDAERAVIIGNGNVALDIARILSLDVAELARTDIADHALEALARSAVREVVVVGRRGPAQAGYTTPELLALGQLPGIDVVADPEETALDQVTLASLAARSDVMAELKAGIATEFAGLPPLGAPRRIRLRFLAAPVEVLGTDRVTGVRLARTRLEAADDGSVVARPTGEHEELDCGLLLRAVGYRGRALPGLPFDERSGTVPNVDGRVVDPETREPVPGVYVAGWIKRGPSGVIGTNRKCAKDTVARLLEDVTAGRLPVPPGSADELHALVRARQPQLLDHHDWKHVDQYEAGLGAAADRPRVKLVDRQAVLEVAAGATRP